MGDNRLLLFGAALCCVAHHPHLEGARTRPTVYAMVCRAASRRGFIRLRGRLLCYPESCVVFGEVIAALMIQSVPYVVFRHPAREMAPRRTSVD
jgi:hypothetical protein